MTRYVESIRTFHNVFRAKRAELTLTVMMILLLLIFASSAMYAAEHEAQPGKFSSIPETRRGVITLTTIGYGDVYPITFCGKGNWRNHSYPWNTAFLLCRLGFWLQDSRRSCEGVGRNG